MSNLERIYVNNQILLYGDVGNPWGFGDGFTPMDVAQALALHGPGDITVRINSGGGIAWDGTAIYSLLMAHPGKVTVVIDGIAASAASMIAMAGAVRSMRGGAMLMIHDASTITFGTAADHEKSTDMLHQLSGQYARVYAERSGMAEAEVRSLMLAETWMTAEAAITAGFATDLVQDATATAAAFDYTIYAHAPQSLPRRASARSGAAAGGPGLPALPTNAAVAAQLKEPPVATPEPVIPTPPVIPAVKAWVPGFYASAENSGITLASLNAIVSESNDIVTAQAALIDAMATARNADKPSPRPAPSTVTADAMDRFKQGATKALFAKANFKEGERNEFTSLSMRELARASLDLAGKPFKGVNATNLMRAAFASAGGHSSSDFVEILANVANKSMLKGYEEATETFEMWTARGSLPDFKEEKRVDLNLFGTLPEVKEGGEYLYASVTDRAERIMLAKYGQRFAITWEAMINDDMSVLTRVPQRMGDAARRNIANLVYGVLTVNPNLSDGVALFQAAAHKNLATGAPSVLSADSLDLARTAMALQRDPESKASALNIQPKYLIVPVTLQGKANQLMNTQTEIGQANPQISSRVAGMAAVVADARLDLASSTAWYLAGDPNRFDTIEVAYLDGQSEPEMFEEEGFAVDGTCYKIRHVAGVAPLGHRALYKSNGV